MARGMPGNGATGLRPAESAGRLSFPCCDYRDGDPDLCGRPLHRQAARSATATWSG